jgi:hypothetical protein
MQKSILALYLLFSFTIINCEKLPKEKKEPLPWYRNYEKTMLGWGIFNTTTATACNYFATQNIDTLLKTNTQNDPDVDKMLKEWGSGFRPDLIAISALKGALNGVALVTIINFFSKKEKKTPKAL